MSALVHIYTRMVGHLLRVLNGGGVAAAAKLLQSCPTLCDPIVSSPPGSAVPGMNGGGGQPKNIS